MTATDARPVSSGTTPRRSRGRTFAASPRSIRQTSPRSARAISRLESDARGAPGDCLPHRPLHLELDELVHLDGVLHRQLLDERLDEPADDHGPPLALRDTPAPPLRE